MNKKTIRDVDLSGKRVLMRVDFNVPLENGRVVDDTRIKAVLPTIRYILDHGAALVLMSHLGRPKGRGFEAQFSLKPVADQLAKLLGLPVKFAPEDCVGPTAKALARELKAGEILLLENTRFHEEEEGRVKLPDTATEEEKKAAKAGMKKRQEAFAKQLAEFGDIFVNDAFGAAHRAHATTAIVCRFFKENVAGFLMEKEIQYLQQVLVAPQHPFLAILGGAKVSDKVNVIKNLLTRVDALIIGGAMSYTFYRARGLPTGKSLVEEEKISVAEEILQEAQSRNIELLLPVDHVIADRFDANAKTEIVGEREIKEGWMALDIGPASVRRFSEEISRAKTIVWNGPMGCFEMKPFAAGTLAVTKAIAATTCLSIVGGGDTVSAINMAGLAEKFTHISTGGGASLEFLEGKELPGVVALSDRT